ncbi:MAG: inositol monophosphatase [Vampirovibrio sp.]|nr:inositol monophosphatase [Vampirovibrio sp.]
MPKTDLGQRLEIALQAAHAAGEVQREFYTRKLEIQTKSSNIDLVTQVDTACDALIQETLLNRSREFELPVPQLLTEESFPPEAQTIDMELDNVWIVDPLDGTTNYAHRFPHFAVSIAYMEAGKPTIAVVYDTMKDETFTAVKDKGAFVNGKPLSVSSVDSLSQALLATGFPYDRYVKPERNLDYFKTFMGQCHGVRRAGSAALDLAYVAAGRLDGFWEMRLAPWDVAAGALLVQEANGQTADFVGKPLNFQQRYIDITAASHPRLLAKIVEICKSASSDN